MNKTDNIFESHSRRGWILSFLFLLLALIYITSFWGQLPNYLPEPLNRWTHFFYSLVQPWWSKHVLLSQSLQTRNIFLWLAINIVLGLVIPAILILLARRKLTDFGIGLPNLLGRRMIIVSIVISIPFGLWFLKTTPNLQYMSLTNPAYTCGLLAMIPEHFFICGIIVALMLPQRRLPHPVSVAAIEGPVLIRLLRWLGLAQPALESGHNRFLAWFGLTGTSLFAILASGMLFGITHFGKGLPELISSFPGGVAVAYVTLRSHSIWPAILAHWAMNLIPLGILSLLG